MQERIHEVIRANHIEAPLRSFFVRFHHRSYRPEGFPFSIPGQCQLAEVLAETQDGAIRVAEYHHFIFGSDFVVETRPALRSHERSRDVEFH